MKDIKINNFLSYTLGEYATEAMLYEVAVYPSPGLVSPVSNGAHEDMDYYTFLKSTAVLSKYMIFFAESGFSKENLKHIFSIIRKIGIEAEGDMFKKTENINTHKGMIFLMGITLANTAKALYENTGFYSIKENIKTMTKGIVSNELREIKNLYEKFHEVEIIETNLGRKLTYGEKLYINYGIEGIRGEVESGLSVVFDGALKVYESNEHKEEPVRILRTLSYLMGHCKDSTLLHRHNIEVIEEVNALGKRLLEIESDKEFLRALEEVNKDFSIRRISPGGTADLLAVTIFLSKVKKEIFKEA